MAKAKTTKKNGKGASKAVVKKNSNLPSKMDFEVDAGRGFEEADQDSYAIPFLAVLQSNSPACDEDDDAYIKGAKPGMFFNTATAELYKEGVILIPVHFKRQYVEWVPRDSGGGFRGSHDVDSIDVSKLEKSDTGRPMLPNGNLIVDTRYHYCIQVTDDGPRNVMLSLTSTQLKKSRAWMTKMSTLRLPGANGSSFNPPTFSHAYLVTTVKESNEKGNWRGLRIELDHMLVNDEQSLYYMARDFRDLIKKGAATPDEASANTNTTNKSDDEPY